MKIYFIVCDFDITRADLYINLPSESESRTDGVYDKVMLDYHEFWIDTDLYKSNLGGINYYLKKAINMCKNLNRDLFIDKLLS